MFKVRTSSHDSTQSAPHSFTWQTWRAERCAIAPEIEDRPRPGREYVHSSVYIDAKDRFYRAFPGIAGLEVAFQICGITYNGESKIVCPSPDHDDHHPSCSVLDGNGGPGRLYCHSHPGANPFNVDPIGLVCEVMGVEFKTAVHLLCSEGNVTDCPPDPSGVGSSIHIPRRKAATITPAPVKKASNEPKRFHGLWRSLNWVVTFAYTSESGGQQYKIRAEDLSKPAKANGKPQKTNRWIHRGADGGLYYGYGSGSPLLFGQDLFTGSNILAAGEGEMVHLALTRLLSPLGIDCTTKPGTGNKLSDAQSEGVRHRKEVWYFADNDAAGRKYAETWVKDCHALGVPIRVIHFDDLHEGFDAEDFESAGGTTSELLERVYRSTLRRPIGGDILALAMAHTWQGLALRMEDADLDLRGDLLSASAVRFIFDHGIGGKGKGGRVYPPADFVEWVAFIVDHGLASISEAEPVFNDALTFGIANRFPMTSRVAASKHFGLIPGIDPVGGTRDELPIDDASAELARLADEFFERQLPAMVYGRIDAIMGRLCTKDESDVLSAVTNWANRILKPVYGIKARPKPMTECIRGAAGLGKSRLIYSRWHQWNERLNAELVRAGEALACSNPFPESEHSARFKFWESLAVSLRRPSPLILEVAVPTWDLAEESAERARGFGVPVHMAKGMTKPDACLRHDEVQKAQDAGLKFGLFEAFCLKRYKDREGTIHVEECPFRSENRCPSFRNAKLANLRGGILFTAHAGLTTGRHSDFRRLAVADFVVIDEAVNLSACCDHGTTIGRDALEDRADLFEKDFLSYDRLTNHPEECPPEDFGDRLWTWLEVGCRRGCDQDPGWDADLLRLWHSNLKEQKQGYKGTPATPIDERLRLLVIDREQSEKFKAARLTARLIGHILSEWRHLGDRPLISGRMDTVRNDGAQERRFRLYTFNRPTAGVGRHPKLMIDATASALIAGRQFGVETIHRIDVADHSHVTQVYGTACSKAWLKKESATEPGRYPNQERLIRIAQKFGADSIICNKSVDGAGLEDTMQAAFPDAKTGHFNDVRGSNAFESCRRMVRIGGNTPPDWMVESVARAMFCDSEKDLDFSISRLARGYSMRSGERIGILTRAFDDERLAAVRSAILESELEQDAARLRGIRRPGEDVRQMIIGEMPVPGITVDRLVHVDVLDAPEGDGITGARLVRCLNRDGILPIGSDGADLAKLNPEEFGSSKVAEMELLRTASVEIPYFLQPVLRYSIQLVGFKDSTPEDRLRRLFRTLDSDLHSIGVAEVRVQNRVRCTWRKVLFDASRFEDAEQVSELILAKMRGAGVAALQVRIASWPVAPGTLDSTDAVHPEPIMQESPAAVENIGGDTETVDQCGVIDSEAVDAVASDHHPEPDPERRAVDLRQGALFADGCVPITITNAAAALG